MSNIIETRGLKKIYGIKGGAAYMALDGVDLQAAKGDFVGIMGPSGAGKTTLLNILATIDRPSAGQVVFNGTDLNQIKDRELARFRRDHIGFLFQDFNLLDNMSVEDNITLPLALSGIPYRETAARLREWAGFFGLEDQLKKYPYQLSGGQRQRAAAARALITSPMVVMADEPTGALDSRASGELLQCLADMNARYGTTIVMVTHDAFAASYCRKIMFLKDGRIHALLERNDSRKEMFHRILDMLASMGGDTRGLC